MRIFHGLIVLCKDSVLAPEKIAFTYLPINKRATEESVFRCSPACDSKCLSCELDQSKRVVHLL